MGNRLTLAARVGILAAALFALAWFVRNRHGAQAPRAGLADTEGAGAAALHAPVTAPARPAAPARAAGGPCVFEDAARTVEFTPDRVRLSVPADASPARPHDLSLRTRRIAAGAMPLYQAGISASRDPGRDGGVVSYVRPAGIVETYDVGRRRVEQSFVLQAPPPARGDLVIDVAVEGSLAPRVHEAPPIKPFDYASTLAHNLAIDYVDDAGRAVVGLGKAWAWDAAKSQVPVEISPDDGGYRLRVDGAWLARAAYPVTVDPPFLILNSTAADATGAVLGHGYTALAYNNGGGAGNNTFMLVIEYQETSGDWDIEWVPLNADGTLAGPVRAAAPGEPAALADVWPDIDYSPTSNNFLIVWARERDANDDLMTKIMGLRVDSAGAPLAAPGGTTTPLGNNNAFVIRDTEVDTPAIPNDDVGHALLGPVDGPKVSWNNLNNRYFVAWRDGEGGGDVAGVVPPAPNRTHAARGRFVRADGTLDAGFSVFPVGPTSNVTSLDVAWNPSVEGGQYMMVLTRTLGSGGPPPNLWEEDVFVNAMSADCDTDGTATGFVPPAGTNLVNARATYNSAVIATFPTADAAANLLALPPDPRARIAADTNVLHPMWLAAWSDRRVGADGGSEIRAIGVTWALNPANPAPDNVAARVLIPDFEFGDSANEDSHPFVAWDSFRDDFLVTWHSTVVGASSDVVGRRMDFGGDFLSGVFAVSTPGVNQMAIRPAAAFNPAAAGAGARQFLVTFVAGNDNAFFGADDDTFGAFVAPPNPPSLLAHSGNTTSSITWTWTDNSNDETEFRVKDGVTTVVTVTANTVTATENVPQVNGTTENTRYVRTVVAANAFGESAPSNAHAAFTSARMPGIPDFSVSLPALPVCRTQVNLTVAAPANACSPYPALAHIPILGRIKGVTSGASAVAGGGPCVFMAPADVPWIYVIDTATDQIVARFNTRVAGNPGYMLDGQGNPDGLGYVANGLAFDTDANGVRKLFLASRVDGVNVINADTGALIQGGICAGSQPFGAAVSPGNHRLHVAGFNSNSIHTYDTTTLAIVGNECSVNLAGSAAAQACPPAGCPAVGTGNPGDRPALVAASATRGFVTCQGGGANGGVGSIDVNGDVSGWVSTGTAGFGIAVHAVRQRLYVGHRVTNYISVLNTAADPPTLLPAAQINLPAQAVSESYGLDVDEASNRLFVVGSGNNLFVYDITTDAAVLLTTFVLDTMQNTITCGQQGVPCNDGGQFLTALNARAYIPSFEADRYMVVNTTATCTSAAIRIERSDDGGATFPTVVYDGPFTANVADTPLLSATNYCWRLTYKNGDGDLSVPSQPVCITTCADPLVVQACGASCAACPAGIVGPDGTVCAMPNATEGGLYQQSVTATGGLGPVFNWSVTAGQMPPGFALSGTGSTVTISGTAAQAQATPFTFTLQVTDSQNPPGSDVRDFSIKIDPPNPNAPPTVNLLPPPPAGTVGVAYSYAFTATSGQTPYTWRIAGGTPPPGLGLDPTTGALSGLPTTSIGSPFTFTVEVTSANGLMGQGVFTITINPNLITIPPSTLAGGTVNAPYNQSIGPITGGIGPTFTWSLAAGSLPPGLAIGGTGRTATLSGTPTLAGTFNFTVQVADDGQPGVAPATRAYSITVTPAGASALTISTNSPLPTATLNQPFQTQLTASGGLPPYTWTVQAGTLPPGLVLDPASGTIAGTPTQAGSFAMTILVQDSGSPFQTSSKTFSLTVAVGPTITTASPLPQGVAGQPGYFAQLSAVNGLAPYVWSVVSGALPGGLALSVSGAINGTPAAAGTSNFTVQVTDANGAAGTKPFALTVLPAPAAGCPPGPTVTTSTLPRGRVGVLFSATLVASGGQRVPLAPCPPSGTPEAYCWSLSPLSLNPLPAWLTLSPNTGVLFGTPAAADGGTTVTLRFRVTDAGGCTADTPDLTLAVDGLVTFVTAVLPDGGVNALYANADGSPVTLQASGGDTSCGGYIWTIVAGVLPSGLSLNAVTGVISGLPGGPVGALPPFTVQAMDCQGQTAQRPFAITIVPAVPLPPPPVPGAPTHSAGFCFVEGGGLAAPAWVGAILSAATLLAAFVLRRA